MKKIKLCSFVVLGLLAVTPVHASDNWLSSLFPWLNASGAGAGGGDPSIPDPNRGAPVVNSNGNDYVPNGAGVGGGHPHIPDPN